MRSLLYMTLCHHTCMVSVPCMILNVLLKHTLLLYNGLNTYRQICLLKKRWGRLSDLLPDALLIRSAHYTKTWRSQAAMRPLITWHEEDYVYFMATACCHCQFFPLSRIHWVNPREARGHPSFIMLWFFSLSLLFFALYLMCSIKDLGEIL